MTDQEMQRIGQIVADEVCQRAVDQIETWCVRVFAIMVAFWIAKSAFVFWKFWWIDEERSA